MHNAVNLRLCLLGMFCCSLLFTPCEAWAERANWTLMLYMAADNDLEQDALIDLDEIEAGMPASGVEIIVLIDRAKGYSQDAGDWTDARVLRMRPDRERGKLAYEEVTRLGEINTGDPQTLTDFVRFAYSRFPARRYGLIMWDHGGGWAGMADDDDTGNDGGHDSLTITELSGALSAAIPQGRKLDFIGFDMCLMAQVETAYELSKMANYMVASQATEGAFGWPYEELLPEFGNPSMGTHALAQNIVRKYATFTQERGERVATLSALDLNQMDRLRAAIDALVQKLLLASRQYWPVLSRSLFWADSFESEPKTMNLERGPQALASSDLLDIIKRMRKALGPRFPAEAEFHGLLRAMDATVLDNHVSRRHRLSHGLSIYAPPNSETFNRSYLETSFARNTRWTNFLQGLYGLQNHFSEPPRVTEMSYVRAGTNVPVNSSSMFDNTTLKLTVHGNNLLWVSGFVGRYSPADKGYLIYSRSYLFDSRFMAERLEASSKTTDLLMPEFRGNTASLEMEVTPATYAISNGEVAAFATLDTRAAQTGQGMSGSITAIYKSQTDGEHEAIIDFDLSTWQATGVSLLIAQQDGRVVPRGVDPKPEDQVTLVYEFLPDGGEFELVRGQTMAWNRGLELIIDEVPNGKYRSWAIVENLSGEKSIESADVEVTSPRRDIKAGFDDARKLSIGDLAGEWWTTDGEAAFVIGEPLSSGSNSAKLQADPASLPPEERDYNYVVSLDTRLLPALHVISYDRDGKNIVGRSVFMLLANRSTPNRLWVKTMIGGYGNAIGEITELVRPARGPGPNPSPLHRLIIGAWLGESPEGYLWAEFALNGQYRQLDTSFDESMRMETWGTYSLQGNMLRLMPVGARRCNSYGCEPFDPGPVPPFAVWIEGDNARTEDSWLMRQR